MWLIKKYSKHIVKPLVALVNLSFQSGVVPSLLDSMSKVYPIFKHMTLPLLVTIGLSPFCQS